MAIYTRTGDRGKTSLFNGKRISKDSLTVEAIGSIDELNAVLGLAASKIKGLTKLEIEKIQSDLFSIGASLANPKGKTSIDFETRAKDFETLIDNMTKKLPKLFNFILPGGGEAGTTLHLARTVCRRAERRLVVLSKKEKINLGILIYINRLSDILFTMARFTNFKQSRGETIWKG